MEGLTNRHRGRPAALEVDCTRARRVLAATRRPPPDGTTHWSCRGLATHLDVSKDNVQRVWREADLRPHRLARYMASNDPDFETKAADIIGLYLDPPRHAAVFLHRRENRHAGPRPARPRVPAVAGPGRASRVRVQAARHAVALRRAEPADGRRSGQDDGRHTSPDFVDFFGEVVATRALDEEIHVTLDNLSTHRTKPLEATLDEHPYVTLHFTPTYSSWLNQLELWFSKVQRDVLSRGIAPLREVSFHRGPARGRNTVERP